MKHILYVIGSLIWMGTCMAANNPDDFELFQSVRQNQPQVTSLSFCNRPQLSSLDPLKYFPNLRGLRIQHCRNVKHLIPILGTLKELHTLHLSSSGHVDDGIIQDISPLSGLHNLTFLSLNAWGRQVNSIKPIMKLPIKRLSLCRQHSIQDLDLLHHFTHIERLNLSQVFYDADRTTPYPSLDFLKYMKELTHLSLSACFMIDDLSPVWTCRKLQSLILSAIDEGDCKWNLNGIENLINIEDLGLGNLHYYRELSYLKGLKKIKKLQIYSDGTEKLALIKKFVGSNVMVGNEIV